MFAPPPFKNRNDGTVKCPKGLGLQVGTYIVYTLAHFSLKDMNVKQQQLNLKQFSVQKIVLLIKININTLVSTRLL